MSCENHRITAGRVIAGKYQLAQPIAEGGMASVWLAQHLGLRTPVAVKVIAPELAALPEMHRRFEREARSTAMLQSPHVVSVFDYGVDEGTPYLVMELLIGEDLGARLKRLGRLSTGEVVAIVTQISRALGRAHSVGIVHRDIKPANIFLVSDGDAETAKLLDFGVAKASTAGPPMPFLTGPNQILGTAPYMSPEQARCARDVDHRADLWALAVVAYFALTGQRAFPSATSIEVLTRVRYDPPVPPSAHVPGLAPEIDDLFAQAFSPNPALRFTTASGFARALAMAASCPPVPTPRAAA
jgi:serine/threonine-protein kinase